MAFPVENWGALKIVTGVKQEGGSGAADVVLSSMPKGNEKTNPNFVSKTMLKVPISSIASAAGTTKNDLSINLRSKASHTPATDLELTSIRFAVPNVCVGYEQTEEAGREILQNIHSKMKEYQQSYLKEHGQGSDDNNLLVLATMGASTTAHADEKVIATFDDVPVAYPSGKYKIVLSNYNVVLEDKRKTATGLLTFPLSDVQQLYLCDIPSYFGKGGGEDDTGLAQYVVLVLRNPMKVRSTSYAHVVISCPPELVLHADHPWRCELKTQEEINKVLGFAEQESGEYPLVPSMSGRVSEIMIRTFKAVAKVPAFGGLNKEYRSVLTQQRHSCLRCMYKSSEGFLFVANKGLLFLHRPAVKIDYSDIDKIEMDESDSGTATFQISVMAKTSTGTEKLVFSSLDKAEKDGLLAFLGTKVKLERYGLEGEAEDDDDDDDDDDEEGNEDSDDDDDDDSDDFDESDDGSDDGGSDDEDEDGKSSRKRDRKHRSSDKDKKHKHTKKKHRHHKKEKKE